MPHSNAALLPVWEYEMEILNKRIGGYRAGAHGSSLTISQREIAISHLIHAAAELRAMMIEAKFAAGHFDSQPALAAA